MGKTKLVKIDNETYDLIKEMETILLNTGLSVFQEKWKKGISKIDQGNVIKLCCRTMIPAIRQLEEISKTKEKLIPSKIENVNTVKQD